MKILVIGGTHGDERTGIGIISHLRHNQVAGVDVLIANPRATKARCRFVETDLNRSFDVGKPRSYEERRAVEIMPILRHYDLVLEFHNTVSRTTCGILTNEFPTPLQLAALSHFSLGHAVMISPGHSLSGQIPSRAVSLEISTRDSRLSLDFLVEKIKTMSRSEFVHDIGTTMYCDLGIKVSRGQLTAAGLKLSFFRDFREIQENIAGILGLEYSCVPFLVGEKAYGKDFAFRVAKKMKEARKGEIWR